MKKLFVLVIFKLLLSGCAYAADDAVIEVIPLLNRPASEVQPLLEPLLDIDDRVTADGSNLLVRTTPERLAEILSIIDSLDTRQGNLIITVLQSRQATADELNAQIRAQLGIAGNDLSKSTGKITAYYRRTQDGSAHDNLQTIRTLDGKPAFIKTGTTYPVQNYQTNNSGYGYSGISTSTQFIDAITGFSVTPRLLGQQVMLDVSPWSDNAVAQGRIQTQEAQSTLTVNLGEWIEIGGADESMQSIGNRVLAHNWQTNFNKLHILIKVDRAE